MLGRRRETSWRSLGYELAERYFWFPSHIAHELPCLMGANAEEIIPLTVERNSFKKERGTVREMKRCIQYPHLMVCP